MRQPQVNGRIGHYVILIASVSPKLSFRQPSKLLTAAGLMHCLRGASIDVLQRN